MTVFQIFSLQTTLSLIVFTMIAAWYVAPRLAVLPLRDAVVPLLLVHAFRYTPLTLLVPGQVDAALPAGVARTIAYGDLASALAAIAAVLMLRLTLPGAVAAVWVFSAVGIGDIVLALARGIGAELYRYELGFNWYVLNYYVPALMVTHAMILARLLRPRAPAETV